MKLIKKIVTAITLFYTAVSGIFLLSGAGSNRLQIMVALIFFISVINLIPNARDYYLEKKKTVRLGGVESPDKKEQGSGASPEKARPNEKMPESAPKKDDKTPTAAAKESEANKPKLKLPALNWRKSRG